MKNQPRNDVHRALATIAYAPVPPKGYGYLVRTAVPRPKTAITAAQRSAHAPNLTFYVDPASRDLYAIPNGEPGTQREMPAHAHLLPINHRPDPSRFSECVPQPIPAPPVPPDAERNARYLKTEAHYPSGSTFCLPQRSTNIHYYRTRYPQATFTDRRGWIYATFPGRAGQHLPPKAYRNPPAPATLSTGPRERVTDPETAHVYINRHAPRTHAPDNVYPDTATPGAYFFPFPLSTLLHPDGHHTTEAQIRYIYSHGHSVQIHPDADPETPPTLYAEHRFQPLPVYRQAHPA